jgi:hypothetical protein
MDSKMKKPKPKGQHGGPRPNSGRPRKPPYVPSPEQAKIYAACTMPLEFLLAVMNDANADPVRRDRAARAAAPFIHRRFAPKKVGIKEEAQSEALAVESGDDGQWQGDLAFRPSKAN